MVEDANPFPLPSPDARPYGPPCPGCGLRRTAGDAAGVGWSSLHTADGGEVVVEFVCPTCTRAEIAQIEAGLPTAPQHPTGRRPYDTVRRAG